MSCGAALLSRRHRSELSFLLVLRFHIQSADLYIYGWMLVLAHRDGRLLQVRAP
jgi:hypothetical protein